MKVLHVVASLSPTWGGPVPVVKGLTEAMAKKGLSVTVFATVVQGCPHGVVQLKGVRVRLFRQDLFSRVWRAYSSELAETLYWEMRL